MAQAAADLGIAVGPGSPLADVQMQPVEWPQYPCDQKPAGEGRRVEAQVAIRSGYYGLDGKQAEHQTQANFVKTVRREVELTRTLPKAAGLFFAIPNGGFRDAATAGKMKAEGVVPGPPDLLFAAPHGCFAGLFVEVKAVWYVLDMERAAADGGTDKPYVQHVGAVKPHQAAYISALRAAGYAVAVGWGEAACARIAHVYFENEFEDPAEFYAAINQDAQQ